MSLRTSTTHTPDLNLSWSSVCCWLLSWHICLCVCARMSTSHCMHACRAEVELRQRLAERDARVSELKQELADRGRQADALQRHINQLLGGGNSNTCRSRSGSGNGGSRAQRSRSATPTGLSPRSSAVAAVTAAGTSNNRPSLVLPADWAAADEASTHQHQQGAAECGAVGQVSATDDDDGDGGVGVAVGAVPSAEQIFRRISSCGSGVDQGTATLAAPLSSANSLAAAEKEYLAHQIAALRISLAKKDAEVARLEGESYSLITGRSAGHLGLFLSMGSLLQLAVEGSIVLRVACCIWYATTCVCCGQQ